MKLAVCILESLCLPVHVYVSGHFVEGVFGTDWPFATKLSCASSSAEVLWKKWAAVFKVKVTVKAHIINM